MKAYLVFDSQLASGNFSLLDIVLKLVSVGAHEIEIPDGATHITVSAGREWAPTYPPNTYIFELPRPRKMVKKWRWLIRNKQTGIYELSYGSYATATECGYPLGGAWEVIRKVDETEIEVPE